MNLTDRESLRLDYADPQGWQEGFEEVPGFWLWRLKKPIQGHPAGSTVSQFTLDAALANLHPLTPSQVKMSEFAELRGLLR